MSLLSMWLTNMKITWYLINTMCPCYFSCAYPLWFSKQTEALFLWGRGAWVQHGSRGYLSCWGGGTERLHELSLRVLSWPVVVITKLSQKSKLGGGTYSHRHYIHASHIHSVVSVHYLHCISMLRLFFAFLLCVWKTLKIQKYFLLIFGFYFSFS